MQQNDNWKLNRTQMFPNQPSTRLKRTNTKWEEEGSWNKRRRRSKKPRMFLIYAIRFNIQHAMLSCTFPFIVGMFFRLGCPFDKVWRNLFFYRKRWRLLKANFVCYALSARSLCCSLFQSMPSEYCIINMYKYVMRIVLREKSKHFWTWKIKTKKKKEKWKSRIIRCGECEASSELSLPVYMNFSLGC